jgi:hypothetical protein
MRVLNMKRYGMAAPRRFLLVCGALVWMANAAGATTIYSEAIDGPVSTDPNLPTQITLAAGVNQIVLTVGPNDVFNFFEIDLTGLTLTEIRLEVFGTQPGNSDSLFANCNAGGPCQPFAGPRVFIDESLEGTDILPALLAQLAPGGSLTDVFVLGEGNRVTEVVLEFITVPEPSTLALLALGGAMLVTPARRRSC